MTDTGFAAALLAGLQPENVLACLAGAVIGTLVGVLPGLGPAAAMALLLPLTLKLGPAAGLIMLAGIYYGAMYGGSTTSILVNVPGEAASVVTAIDGYRLARRGRAGAALAIAAIASFVAGTFSVAALQLLAPAVARAALAFGPAEYFAFTLLGPRGAREPDRPLAREGAGDGRARPRALDGRDGPAGRHRALHVGRRRRPGRPELHRGRDRALRRRRSAGRRGAAGADPGRARPAARALPEPRGAPPSSAADAPGQPPRIPRRPDPGPGGDHRLVRVLRRGAASLEIPGRAGRWRHRGRRGPGGRQQRGGRRRHGAAPVARVCPSPRPRRCS